MSQDENVATQIKPWLNVRVNDLYADHGLTPGCLKLPQFPNDYFISNGTVPIPTPKSSITANAKFARFEFVPDTYSALGINNLLINPVPTFDNTTGLTFAANGITFVLFGTYLVVHNILYNSTNTGSVTFNIPQPGSDYSAYWLPVANNGANESFVYSVYINTHNAGYFEYTMQWTVDNPDHAFQVLAGSHLTIIQFSSD